MSATATDTTAIEEVGTNQYQATIAVQITTTARDRFEAERKFRELGHGYVAPHVANGFHGSLDQWDLIRFRDMQLDGPRAARRERTVLVAFGVAASSMDTTHCAVGEFSGLVTYRSQHEEREARAAAETAVIDPPSEAVAIGTVDRALTEQKEERGLRMNQGTITGYTILPGQG